MSSTVTPRGVAILPKPLLISAREATGEILKSPAGSQERGPISAAVSNAETKQLQRHSCRRSLQTATQTPSRVEELQILEFAGAVI